LRKSFLGLEIGKSTAISVKELLSTYLIALIALKEDAMSCMYFQSLRRTLSVAAISTLITLVPVAAGAESLAPLKPAAARNIVITMDKDPRLFPEAACTAVTAARVLHQPPKLNVTNDVTLLPVLNGVKLARAAVLNSRVLKRHKCTVPNESGDLVEMTLKENLEGFLGCNMDANPGDVDDCRGDNHQGGFAHLYPCFICWKTRFGDNPSDIGLVAPDKEVPAILDAETTLYF
jgi:hypothetical protein